MILGDQPTCRRFRQVHISISKYAQKMCKIYKEVLRLVSEVTEISAERIVSHSRLAEVVEARQMVVWFCFKAGMYPRTIAEQLGISRQAVCQKIQTIADRRQNKAFEFVFQRVASRVKEKGIII